VDVHITHAFFSWAHHLSVDIFREINHIDGVQVLVRLFHHIMAIIILQI